MTYTLQKEGARVAGFEEWYQPKQDEMRADELMRFLHDARVADFHKGKSAIEAVGTSVEYLSIGDAEPPPKEDAVLGLGAEGPFWIVDEGKPTERRIPVKSGGRWGTTVSLRNAPKSHRGKTIVTNDPVSVAGLAVEYLEELVHEARTRSWT